MLSRWLNDATIQLATSMDDWQQALAYCARPLLDQGVITPGYLEAIQQQYRQLGPYFVLAPGLAMPHARPEQGALATGLALLKLEQGVTFGGVEQEPVDLIILLAAADRHSHIDALAALAELFSSETDLAALHAATRREEIMAIIARY
ncbi:PTS sugar transporter subunit IIA [Enterobacteriaceae bacterium BIT-l23]|uniref:PTS sugar transporter subunit IIA n=1 Tax=Jejubacter calystegiae TaxID=2579935 RepID=A0A4P8YPX1_9ENTR|nr:PTS sugar transporter subunit IIA [Jejubacter calystegiae]NUU67543.1 PTS sugar transporter subunit IIA [Enterobacteriaceae bacterium BIT-l23]QCT22206.1 PTS sugar transporter subunit IIA [Jejubacter calystegiae]